MKKTTNLPVPDACGCMGGIYPKTGINVNVSCTLEGLLCIPNTKFCVVPIWEGIYYRRGLPSTTLLVLDATEFFGYNRNTFTLQPFLLQFTHTIPLALANPIDFSSCRAAYGTTLCTSCEICSNGNGFKFDCSNINLINTIIASINLPKVNTCIEIPGL
jgi:hypothetical protein